MSGNKTPASLRVAFDQEIFLYQQHGGISRYFTRLAEHLPAFQIDPRVVAPLYFTDLLKAVPDARVLGMHVGWSPRKVEAGRLLARLLHGPIVRALGVKVVHETHFHQDRLAPRGAALVLTVYDMISEMNPDFPDSQEWIAKKRAAISRADRILCISDSTRRDLLKYYPEVESRLEVILLGVDSVFGREETEARQHQRPYLLYVGIRRDYKNFDGLLRAYAASNVLQSNFDIVSVGHHSANASERELVSSLGISDQVHFRQAHTDDELRNWYHHAAVFAYPSLYEGFGIPPLEAMAAGCPVVCMNISSMPEVCGGAAEYVDPAHPEALGEALERVALSPGRSAELRQLGKKRATQFSWQECARRTSEVYKALS